MPNTHRIVNSGKDGEVKMWDGDTFVRIQTLSPGHVGEVWGVAVAPNGRWILWIVSLYSSINPSAPLSVPAVLLVGR